MTEVSSVSSKFSPANGWFTVLPFTVYQQNATTGYPYTTTLALSSSAQGSPYAFSTTSTDYPWIMPISYVNTDTANYTNTFANYQCFTTLPPTQEPSLAPSAAPSLRPSVAPSMRPSNEPSLAPNVVATAKPSSFPSNSPSKMPTFQPSSQPSLRPSFSPSAQPSLFPTLAPSSVAPSFSPSNLPSLVPTLAPSSSLPSTEPTGNPSAVPTASPSQVPSSAPTLPLVSGEGLSIILTDGMLVWLGSCSRETLVDLSISAYYTEVASVSSKYTSANGFYTALPFTTFNQNATTALPTTTVLNLSSQTNNNIYAFTTTSTDYPVLMPISYVNPNSSNYTKTFSNYQCWTFSTLSPSFFPSILPTSVFFYFFLFFFIFIYLFIFLIIFIYLFVY